MTAQAGFIYCVAMCGPVMICTQTSWFKLKNILIFFLSCFFNLPICLVQSILPWFILLIILMWNTCPCLCLTCPLFITFCQIVSLPSLQQLSSVYNLTGWFCFLTPMCLKIPDSAWNLSVCKCPDYCCVNLDFDVDCGLKTLDCGLPLLFWRKDCMMFWRGFGLRLFPSCSCLCTLLTCHCLCFPGQKPLLRF